VSYGSAPDPARLLTGSWRDIVSREVRPAISDTEPLREVIRHDHTGRLVNVFEAGAPARQLAWVEQLAQDR
jgi:hypothetical protein